MDLEIVARSELKNTATEYEKIFLVEHPAEWHVALLNMQDSVDRQIERWKHELKQKEKTFQQGECSHEELVELHETHEEWRSRTLHFRSLVVARARQVKVLRQKQYEQLHTLKKAIKRHYLSTLVRDEAGTFLTPTSADLELWGTLDLDPNDYDEILEGYPRDNNHVLAI